MIFLHPYSSDDLHRKQPTWNFLASISEGYKFEHRKIDRPMDYPNLLLEMWGRDDLIILEDDKVPTARDLKELVDCRYAYCAFPYRPSFHFRASMSLWTEHFPFSLGFVKFSLKVQTLIPAEVWYREGEHWGVDRAIEQPMISQYGPFHIHKHFIKHNHNSDPVGRLKALKYEVLQAIR